MKIYPFVVLIFEVKLRVAFLFAFSIYDVAQILKIKMPQAMLIWLKEKFLTLVLIKYTPTPKVQGMGPIMKMFVHATLNLITLKQT